MFVRFEHKLLHSALHCAYTLTVCAETYLERDHAGSNYIHYEDLLHYNINKWTQLEISRIGILAQTIAVYFRILRS